MRVVVVTHFLSPYQVELFNEVSKSERLRLAVMYLHRKFSGREWAINNLRHPAIFLDDARTQLSSAISEVDDAELAVFNYYAEQPARGLINTRAATKRPWCFWGERIGFRKPEWIGQIARRFLLSS